MTATQVDSLHIRYDITSQDAKTSLQNAARVAVVPIGPFKLGVSIASHKQRLNIPFPLNATAGKTRIAQKQLWIEYTAPVADMRSLALQPTAVFLVSMRHRYDTSISTCKHPAPCNVSIKSSPVLEHLAYVDADRLPKPRLNSAKWLALHTTCLAIISTVECKEFQLVRANDRLVVPGRLGVKESMNGNFSHVAGLDGPPKNSWFCPSSTSGHICLILVDCVRMDLSHQTVNLDAALFQRQNSNGFDYLWPLMESLSGKISGVTVNDEEALFWKHLLPTFAERCRLWEHKYTCEYQIAGRMPVSTAAEKPLVCSCGAGKIPGNFLVTTPRFKAFAKHAIRVSIPVIFASPISKNDMGTLATRPSPSPPQRPSASTTEVDVLESKPRCLKCGATTIQAGNPLEVCARCKTAHYCSPDHQRKDWKRHKQVCKRAREKAAEDSAA